MWKDKMSEQVPFIIEKRKEEGFEAAPLNSKGVKNAYAFLAYQVVSYTLKDLLKAEEGDRELLDCVYGETFQACCLMLGFTVDEFMQRVFAAQEETKRTGKTIRKTNIIKGDLHGRLQEHKRRKHNINRHGDV